MSNKWKQFLVSIERELEKHGDSFLRGPTISSTMHPGRSFQKLAKEIYDFLQKSQVDISSVKEPQFGSPIIIHNGYSLVTLQSLYNIHLISERLGSIDQYDHIVDIGGGYGNLCNTVYNMGFDGSYTIYDFPIINKIQQRFLSNTCPTKQIQYKQLADDWTIDQNSLLIATYSMSEMPLEDREIVSSHLNKFKSIFIIYQKTFDEFPNKQYFNSLVENHPEFTWQSSSCSLRKSEPTILSGEKK